MNHAPTVIDPPGLSIPLKNTIDAVAMTRRIREAHHERLKDATGEERIRFYREEAAQLHELIARNPGTG